MSMRLRDLTCIGLVALALAAPALVFGEDAPEALDANPRPDDTVYLKNGEKIVCKITKGDENSATVSIQKGTGSSADLERGQIDRIVHRQTYPEAFADRSKRILAAGTSAEHRTLADWAWKNNLDEEAITELRKAWTTAKDPADVAAQAGRLARVLLARSEKLDEEKRDDAFDEILTIYEKQKAGTPSPDLEHAVGKVLLIQGLVQDATKHLEKARDLLAASKTGTPGPDEADLSQKVADAPKTPSDSKDPKSTDPKSTDPKSTDPKKGDKGDKPLKNEAPSPRFPKMLGDDKKDAPPPGGNKKKGDKGDKVPDPAGGDPPAAPPPSVARDPIDKSADVWPGLSPAKRLLYKENLQTLGQTYMKLERVEDAVKALSSLVEAYPEDRAALALRAQAYMQLGDPKSAVADLKAALGPLNDRDGVLLRDRGIAKYSLGDLDAAKEDLDNAISAGLDDPKPAQAHIALIQIRQGKFKAAKETLDGIQGDCALGKLAQGLLKELSGSFDEAATLYEAALRTADADPFTKYTLAIDRAKGGKPEEAATLLREALKDGLPFSIGAMRLAEAARGKKDAKEEVKVLEELVGSKKAPTPDELVALGRAYASADRLEDARAAFDDALTQQPAHVGALMGAGWVRYKQDDRDAAKGFFKKALAAEPLNSYAKQALTNLDNAETREVWKDEFHRNDGDVKNGWLPPEQGYGVDVSIKGKKLVFEGTQANKDKDQGKTRLARDVPNRQVLRVEARLDLSKADQAACGLRFESEKGSAIIFKAEDGSVKVAISASSKQGFSDPITVGQWPKDGSSHVFAIEIEEPNTGVLVFSLDDQRLGDPSKPPLKVNGIGHATKPQVALYGYAALNAAWGMTAEEIRIYARRESR